ncbi:hypothetical protein [Antribacter gilvus]|uniref:hypothetical protein n=1 Tax=Antribacter gilvus TaxID=2304675 RepID=UPI0013DF4803|nr:hypothetical protein [Antribacter gilvus]
MSADEPVDVDALLDALYGGPLDEFVAGRDAAARQVAGSGDRVGAERVKKLPKPTVAAWVANQVAREHPEEVAALASIGDELRAATSDRDRGRIKALDRLRRERTEALVGVVRDAGEVGGRPVSANVLDRLAETLTAAVMDPAAAAVVRAGRLSQALQHVGFGVVDEGGETADVVALRAGVVEDWADRAPRRSEVAGSVDIPTDAATADRRDAPPEPGDALADAEREVEETSAEVDALEARHDEAERRLREMSAVVGQREEEVARLEAEIERLVAERDAAREALDDQREAEGEAREELEQAEVALDDAEERAAEARKRRREARRSR